MGTLLGPATEPVLDALHPDVPGPGRRYVAALAAWVFEYDTDKYTRGSDPVAHVHLIHESRLECPFGREKTVVTFRGFGHAEYPHGKDRTDPAVARKIKALTERVGTAQEIALRYGILDAFYGQNDFGQPDNHPTHKMIDLVGAALAREVASRDVASHLAVHPLSAPIQIDGVAVDAKPLHGRSRKVREWERTQEIHEPADPTEAASLLLRKVELEWVGRLWSTKHPEWRPNGFQAAVRLRALAGELTGVPVVSSPVPEVLWNGARLVVTDEILDLLPVLEHMPAGTTTKQAPESGRGTHAPSGLPAQHAPARPRRGGQYTISDFAAEMADETSG